MKNKTAQMLFILGPLIVIVIVVIFFNYATEKSVDITNQPNYEQQLENAIITKNEEIKNESKDFFVATEEMEEKYLNIKPREGALKEINLKVNNDIIEPHVLGHAEAGIYYNESNLPWNLKKGDKVVFKTYVDSKYYGAYGSLYFGFLKEEENFLIKMIKDRGEELKVSSEEDFEKDFECVISEDGEYRFYLFRGSMEPIIIKGIEVSIK